MDANDIIKGEIMGTVYKETFTKPLLARAIVTNLWVGRDLFAAAMLGRYWVEEVECARRSI